MDIDISVENMISITPLNSWDCCTKSAWIQGLTGNRGP